MEKYQIRTNYTKEPIKKEKEQVTTVPFCGTGGRGLRNCFF